MNSGFAISIVFGGLILGAVFLPSSFVYASSDFNNDGKDDLAIGASGESVGARKFAGSVNALYGSSTGISSSGDQLWNQDTANILGTAQTSCRFGYSLASGDFNGDSRSDLAIGAYSHEVGTVQNAGTVNIIYGVSSDGLGTANNQIWTQNSSGVEDTAETNDFFGWSLS